MRSKNQFIKILLTTVLLTSAVLLFRGADKPFWGHHDWNSVVYSNIARNYIRYGYFETKLGQVTNVDFQPKESWHFITHYPPLLPLLISFSFTLFGQSELSARSVIILFSLLFIFSIYKIGELLHSKFFGLFAATSLMLTPIFLYFGKLPVHDTIVPPLSAFGFWVYLKYLKSNKQKHFYLLILILVCSGFVNWSALYLTGAIIIHLILNKGQGQVNGKILLLAPISVLIFAIHIIHVQVVGADTNNVFSNLLERVNPFLTKDAYSFGVIKYLKQEYLFLKIYYTWPLFAGAMVGLLLSAFNFFQGKSSTLNTAIVALFFYGIFQLVVFSQLSFIHDYMIYYLSPFVALSGAYFYFLLGTRIKKHIAFPVLLTIVLAGSFVSGIGYTNTLLKTDVNKRGYTAVQIIKNIQPGEKAYVTSGSYKEFQEVFIAYYSDRAVDYGETLPENVKQYSIIVRPKDHDPLSVEDKYKLDKNFFRYENENFIWYRTN